MSWDISNFTSGIPAEKAGILAWAKLDGSGAQASDISTKSVNDSNIAGTSTVAQTMAAVAGVVDEQMEIAEIRAKLQSQFTSILHPISFSAWISGAEEVEKYANAIKNIIRVRKGCKWW